MPQFGIIEHFAGGACKSHLPGVEDHRPVGQLERRDRVLFHYDGGDAQLLDLVQDRIASLAERAATIADSPGRTLVERVIASVHNLDRTLVDAMAEEAARLSAAINSRIEERARRG